MFTVNNANFADKLHACLHYPISLNAENILQQINVLFFFFFFF